MGAPVKHQSRAQQNAKASQHAGEILNACIGQAKSNSWCADYDSVFWIRRFSHSFSLFSLSLFLSFLSFSLSSPFSRSLFHSPSLPPFLSFSLPFVLCFSRSSLPLFLSFSLSRSSARSLFLFSSFPPFRPSSLSLVLSFPLSLFLLISLSLFLPFSRSLLLSFSLFSLPPFLSFSLFSRCLFLSFSLSLSLSLSLFLSFALSLFLSSSLSLFLSFSRDLFLSFKPLSSQTVRVESSTETRTFRFFLLVLSREVGLLCSW